MLKRLLRRIVPPSLLRAYHKSLAILAAKVYGDPSSRMLVIGVTGTNGKTTTANMIAAILEGAGHTVGLATTSNFRIAGKERLNATKMTMLGRFALQKLMRQMADAGCTHAVIETSSEGIAQFRHVGVAYDMAVLTNLTPEHLESHGGFENYKAAKLRLFETLMRGPEKRVGGVVTQKVFVVNLASPHAKDFLAPPANKKYGYFVARTPGADDASSEPALATWPLAVIKALEPSYDLTGASFTVRDVRFHVPMLGQANVENALAAISVGIAAGAPLEGMAASLRALRTVPGRQETVHADQDFVAMVDYAHEPEAMRRLYEMLAVVPRGRTIHVIGSAGGGRDKARRSVLGKMAGERADVVVVANEDPYDDDPRAIMEAVAAGAREAGKKDGSDLFLIEDRRAALEKAVSMAAKGDLVLATGKGAEQWICVADGKKVPWDERTELQNAIVRSRERHAYADR